ncbi:Neurotransmitter-gated ion-channel transmembrane region, partial [Ostertagia ostertagi]
VEFFPFDDQRCSLTFGSWTYSRNEVQLDFLHADRVDFSEYATSSIWDMMDAPAVLTEDRSRIEFQEENFVLHCRVILPTVLMAFLNVTVFYLPTASGEKMGLTMNVLLSIVVFLLLVSKILPPTSLSIPLVAKYLLLTFVLNIITFSWITSRHHVTSISDLHHSFVYASHHGVRSVFV